MWTKMKPSDVGEVSTLGNSIHLNFFEDPNVFRERFELYGDGCYVYKKMVPAWATVYPPLDKRKPATLE